MCALSEESAKSSVVLDRETDQEKSLDRQALALDARFAVGRPARTITGLVLAATHGTRSTQGGVPRLPAQLDFNTVSVVYPLVSTFRLVCAVMKHSKQKYESRHRT